MHFAERMKLKYSKRKRITQETFNEGDLVTIRVPKIDRSSTDQPRLVTKVASTRGEDGNVWYKLKCKFGLLQGWYRIGELMPYGEICNIAFDNEALISMREAEWPSLYGGQPFWVQYGYTTKFIQMARNNVQCPCSIRGSVYNFYFWPTSYIYLTLSHSEWPSLCMLHVEIYPDYKE